jgi:DNA-binding CsgD family transcriptional regulator
MDEIAYQRLVSAIYDLALAPDEWPTVLRLLGCALNCHYAAAIATTPDRDAPRSLGAVGITDEDHREFLRTWHKHNLYGSRWPAREAGVVVLGRSIAPRAQLVPSAMYRHYLAPRAIEEVVRLDIFHENDRSQSVSLARPWSSGPFTPDELRFAHAVIPHLQHAAAVQVRLGDVSTVARSALDALETAQAPILLLDRRGCIVHVSAEAEQLLREADGLSAGATGLRAATPALSSRLTALIKRSVGAAGSPGASGALRLPRPSGRPDLMLVAVPLRPDMAYPGARSPAIVLQVTDPLACAAPDRALLAEAFGLTPAEASLAADLLRGLSAGEVAAGNRRSIATVRTHLANVLAKTETARQSELVRLLMRLPRTAGR